MQQYPKRWNSAPEDFRFAQQVVDIQNDVLSIISGGTNTFSYDSDGKILLEKIYEQEAAAVRELINYFKTKEEELYTKLGCGNYKGLYKKAEEWSNSASAILNNDKIISDIMKIAAEVDNNLLPELANQLVAKMTNDQNTSILTDIFNEDINNFVNGEIISVGTNIENYVNKSGKNATRSIYIEVKNGKGEKGLKKTKTQGVTIAKLGKKAMKNYKTNKQPNTDIYQIRFTTKMRRQDERKLAEELNNFLSDQNQLQIQTYNIRKKEIINAILREIPEASDNIRQTISNTIDELIFSSDAIKLANNYSIVKGAIGEIYWNAFLKWCGVSPESVGTNVLVKNQQLPIDIILDTIGFQVKHYKIENGIFTINTKKIGEKYIPEKIKLSTFFGERLQEDEEVFGKFLFSMNYNKWNEKEDKTGIFIPIEERFQPIFQGIESYVEASARKLGKFDKDFLNSDLVDITYDKDSISRPTFYFINNKPYPSSVILENFLEVLENPNTLDPDYEKIISVTDVDFSNLSSFDVSHTWYKKENPNISKRLNSAYITYKVEINLNKIEELLMNVSQ